MRILSGAKMGETSQSNIGEGQPQYINQCNAGCEKCAALVASRRQVTWGFGNPNALIMFIGEAPGRWGCDITGIPFTHDRSGKFFRECMRRVHLSDDNCWVTNLVKCCPPENREPTPEEEANCRPYVNAELAMVNPAIIVAVGRHATSAIIPDAGSMFWCSGKHFAHPTMRYMEGKLQRPVIVIPLLHPAYVLRNPEFRERYFEMWKSIARKLNNINEKLEAGRNEKKQLRLQQFSK